MIDHAAQIRVPLQKLEQVGQVNRFYERIESKAGCHHVLDDRAEFASENWFPDANNVRLVDFNDAFRDVRIGPYSHIVLVTRGHKYDYDCILQLLRREARQPTWA